MTGKVSCFADLDELSEAAASFVSDRSDAAISERGHFTIALAGGSTPRRLYEILASPAWAKRISWGRWQVFFSDERLVELSDERSNFRMANETLLNQVPLPSKNVHSVPVDVTDSRKVAEQYEASIRRTFEQPDTVPRFDLILLGLGSDGHTASLFPGKPALTESQRLVVDSEPGVLPPPVPRITFTFSLINAAHSVLFLVAGEDKRKAFRAAILGSTGNADTVPAARVRPTDGTLDWYIDSTAKP